MTLRRADTGTDLAAVCAEPGCRDRNVDVVTKGGVTRVLCRVHRKHWLGVSS